MMQIEVIDKSQHENDGNFLQTPFWCTFKSRHGWSYKRFLIDKKECAVLTRSFCHKLFTICYIPLFPKFTEEEIKVNETSSYNCDNFCTKLNEIAMSLKPFLPKNTIFVRFDPDIIFNTPQERDSFNDIVIKTGKNLIRKSSTDIQPPDSTLVDLTLTQDEILQKMHSKWRYNIKLAAKKGVEIQKYTKNSINLSEKVDVFYALTKETNARDGNTSHNKTYYKDLLESSFYDKNLNSFPQVNLYIARHEGDEIAAIITLFSGDEAVYLYGASSNKKRNFMPNYLLQWTAMCDAKSYGSKYYDMYGMPPQGKDENHPMHGLYMFKVNFGGTCIHRPGSYDVPLSFLFNFYAIAEKLRAFWYKKVLKKIRGR